MASHLDPLVQAVLADSQPGRNLCYLVTRSVICLTASALNSSGYRCLLMAPLLDLGNEAQRCLENPGRFTPW
jgi:hypothetical protein